MENINFVKLLSRIFFKNKFIIGFICLFVSKKQAKKLKKNAFKLDLKFILNVMIKYKGYDFICPPPGFGEMCTAGGYIKAYKKQNKGHKIVILCQKYSHFLYAKDLITSADDVLFMPNGYNKFINVIDIDIYNIKKYGNDFNFKNMKVGFAKKLNLKNEDNFEFETTEVNASKKIENIFKEMGFNKNKTILINIYSMTLDCDISDLEWVELATVLSKKGYDVVFNESKSDFYGFKTLFLTPKESLEFLLLGGNFISIRTGFCDIAINHLNNLRSLVIYPKNGNNAHTSKEIMEFYSLNDMFNTKNTKEIIFKDFAFTKSIIDEYFK